MYVRYVTKGYGAEHSPCITGSMSSFLSLSFPNCFAGVKRVTEAKLTNAEKLLTSST